MAKKGLTLMELLVSALIMALVMLGMTNLFVSGKRLILHSRSRMAGGEVGKFFLDPLQMQVSQEDWTTNCLGTGVGCPGAPATIGPVTYTPTYTIDNVAGTDLRRARVDIQWNEASP